MAPSGLWSGWGCQGWAVVYVVGLVARWALEGTVDSDQTPLWPPFWRAVGGAFSLLFQEKALAEQGLQM